MFKKKAFVFIIFALLFCPSFSYGMSIEEFRLKWGGEEYAKSVKEQEEKRKIRDAQAQQKLESEASQQETLYRNDEYKFRINFPAGWEIKDGDGAHVVKKAVKDGCTILVLVKDSQEENTLSDKEKSELNSIEFSDFSDEEANQLLDEIIKENEVAFPGSKTIEKGIRYIDNRKAGYYKVSTPYKVANVEVSGVGINYFTIHRGKSYQIMGAYPTAPVNEKNKEPIINASLITFVFEDWEDTENIQNQASANASSKWSGDLFGGNINGWEIFLAIIISILFTWVFGLLIPILFRFVIFKDTLSKGASAAIAGVVWIIQLITSEALGNSGKHLAFVLVAYVSYRIMRSGSHKEEMPKFCKECGNQINASATICNKCHKTLTKNVQYSRKRWKELLLAIVAIISITLLISFVAILFS